MATSFESSEVALQNRKWVVVDVADQPLGRVASKIASILRGKDKPSFTPHNDDGDFVVVVNAEKVKLTGNKESGKVYYRHSGYVGGLKQETAGELRQRDPEGMIVNSVKGMIPKTPLGRRQLSKLKVYKGEEHPHQAQCG